MNSLTAAAERTRPSVQPLTSCYNERVGSGVAGRTRSASTCVRGAETWRALPRSTRRARSALSATSDAVPSRSRRCGPTLAALVTGPGTAPTLLPSSKACCATPNEPDRPAASTIAVVDASAAISRPRAMNRCRVGTAPGGTSLTRSPTSATRSSSSRWPVG